MRSTAFAFAVLMLAVPAAAQERDYEAVLGAGDLAETPAAESGWNLVQMLRFTHDNATTTQLVVMAPSRLDFRNEVCPATCNVADQSDARIYTFSDETPSGTHVLTVTFGSDTPTGTAWVPNDADGDSVSGIIRVHAPPGHAVSLPGTDSATGTAFYDGTLPRPFYVAVLPDTSAPAAPEEGFGWFELASGLVAGAAIWAFLVARGTVQRRTRRQVAGPAAHEGLRGRPRDELEARKRVLMAALKDLEKAKVEGLDTAIYDAVRADLKKQTVTVMRALEDEA